MDDRELLGLLAAEAPPPSPDLADAVIAAGRRSRARRRWTTAGGLVLAAAVAVAVPVVLNVESYSRPGETSLSAPEAQPLDAKAGSDASVERKSPQAALPEAASVANVDVYVTAIEAFLAENGTPPRILDKLCPLQGSCTEQPLDGELKKALSEQLPSVRFVQETDAPLRLGEAQISGTEAQVPVSGRLLRLEFTGDRWQVVDGL